MKILYSLLSLLFSAVVFSGQTTSNSAGLPELEIIQQKWRIEVRNPALEEDPFRAVNEYKQAQRARQENMRENEQRQRQGKTSEAERVRLRPDDNVPRGVIATYIYELKVKNVGQKEIRTVTWDYIFFEPGTDRELGRRRFISDVKIEPGKTKNLVVRTAIPPTETISSKKIDRKLSQQFSEKTIVYSIEYADNSIWLAVSN